MRNGVPTLGTSTGGVFTPAPGGLNIDPIAIGVGAGAGTTKQIAGAVAIGSNAGSNGQKANAVSIGLNAGRTGQQDRAIAIGSNAGNSGQSEGAIAIGQNAANTDQKVNAIAIGFSAGITGVGSNTVAIGFGAGTGQQNDAIAIGTLASPQIIQAERSIAIGDNAESGGSGGTNGIAIGISAGRSNSTLSTNTIAIGNSAGSGSTGFQRNNAIAIGNTAAENGQEVSAIAIGAFTGLNNNNDKQPANSIVISAFGVENDTLFGATNSIMLATSALAAGAVASAFYVKPIRSRAAVAGEVPVFYNNVTKEFFVN